METGLAAITARIVAAARAAGREPRAITLVAVSKTQPAARVAEVMTLGQRVFGENRVNEAAEKFPALKARHPDLRLHLIGALQTNKVREAVALFDVIESLDRPRLAEALARQDRRPDCFVQVNTGAEPQKSGVSLDAADRFIERCRGEWRLAVTGLMCLPPQGEDPAPHFERLAALARRHGLPHLSMGMSGDFETAIACGATEVRIGTAIFGGRGGPLG
ncbi:MAG TPA: YggS family pyridoxal phosphate-dependent enzyme [Stellaceae bacterium]|nr:YggS family pyridoxal phosphate-dependent enzyme [Stellaceae bacterium]